MITPCRKSAMVLVALLLAGCSDSHEADGDAAPLIAPGYYGNVATSGAPANLTGIELFLRQGSNSSHVEITHCDGACDRVARLPIRRGFGGISIDYPAPSAPGHAVIMAVQPAVNAITLSVDWGEGLQTYDLPKIVTPVGLNAARRGTAESQSLASPIEQPTASPTAPATIPAPANPPEMLDRIQHRPPPPIPPRP